MKVVVFMKNDVILNKISVIERCLLRIQDVLKQIIEKHLNDFSNYTEQILKL
jgi:hypothetical protein